MIRASSALLVLLAAASSCAGAKAGEQADGPASALAWQNWVLQCQGCHRPDGSGSPDTAPAIANQLARLLAVSGGREYLIQVPGVANAPLKDADLAELMNWLLKRFDAANMPADFRPYSAAEVARLRSSPLRTNAPAVRAALIATLQASPTGAANSDD